MTEYYLEGIVFVTKEDSDGPEDKDGQHAEWPVQLRNAEEEG